MTKTLDLSRARWRRSSYSAQSQGNCVEATEAAWRKSSYSAQPQGNCVEVAEATWRKSGYSAQPQGQCVEVADAAPVAVRDSKNPDAGVLAVHRTSWTAFVAGVKRFG